MATNYQFFALDLVSGNQVGVPEASLPASPPNGPAGGGLAGTYPNPTIAAVPDAALSANVPVMTAGVLPAVDGSLLTNLPLPAFVDRGLATLDPSGQFSLSTFVAIIAVVVSKASAFVTGDLIVSGGGGSWLIQSTNGAVDAGQQFYYIGM